jgi:hypothetical protein
MGDARSVERELLKVLQFGGLDKENLANLVKIIARFSDQGMEHIKVFPRGLPPIYDGVELKSVVQADQLNTILNIVLNEIQVTSIRIFPYGIPVYDIAELVVALGPSPMAGAAGMSEAAE